MLGAMGRYVKAFFYLITGRIDSARKEISKNPYVIQAQYDSIIRAKTGNIHRYKQAVAEMITQEEKKLATLKKLSEEVGRLERLKEGAGAKAKSLVEKLRASGADTEAIKNNPEYKQCLSAFNDFSSTLTEKNRHIAGLEEDLKQLTVNVASHKVQLQELLREIDKLREESSAAVADIITSKEEQGIADMIAGISKEGHAKELQELREMRERSKAEARVSRELAGTDTKRQEAEFLDYATRSGASDEFDRLIGLAAETDSKDKSREDKARTRLPES
ncbi:MAG: PspA/IM30 family protein [Planctomycetota bacterium]